MGIEGAGKFAHQLGIRNLHAPDCRSANRHRLGQPVQRGQDRNTSGTGFHVARIAGGFHLGIPFQGLLVAAGFFKGDGVLEGNLVVAFGGGFTGMFGGVHGDEGWFHRHLRSSSKIVNRSANCPARHATLPCPALVPVTGTEIIGLVDDSSGKAGLHAVQIDSRMRLASPLVFQGGSGRPL